MYHTLIFYEPLTPKQYLDTVLNTYPYDIAPSLVYTLLTKTPYPHPSLLIFIDYIRKCEKKQPKFPKICHPPEWNAQLHTSLECEL